ncbi:MULTISPECIES: LTXXQ domain protein [Pseudomonas]|uniref:LTXXQ domain protein n=1 Tax=Pseudomonas TaxID=286 RepID=UPI0022F038BD|nr:LTXXQ domain protein [Pseudomonas tohonis]
MRKTIAALLLAAALPTVAMAMPEDGPGPERGFGGPGHGGPGLFKELDLSREQRHQVGKLMGDSMRSRHDITQKYLDKLPAADKKAMQDELKASEEKNRAEIRALLKPEQQKEFDELQKKMEERRAERAEFEAWKAQRAQKAQ